MECKHCLGNMCKKNCKVCDHIVYDGNSPSILFRHYVPIDKLTLK